MTEKRWTRIWLAHVAPIIIVARFTPPLRGWECMVTMLILTGDLARLWVKHKEKW